jgi:aspartokinase
LVKRDLKLAKSVSVTRAVQDEVGSDLAIQDAMARDYVNISALSRMLVPKVAARTKKRVKDVSEVGIATALKRLQGTYSVSSPRVSRVIGGSVVNVRTHVSRLSVEKTKRTVQTVSTLLAAYPEDFIQVSESLSSITLIFDQRLHARVKRSLSGAEVLEEGDDGAAVTVHSPEEIQTTPGCISAFYNQLSRRRVNVEDTVSCYTDTIMVVDMKDAGKAFEALAELINEERGKLGEGTDS